MLQPFNHLRDPSLDSLPYVHVSPVLGNPELHAVPIPLSKAEQRGAIKPAGNALEVGGHFSHNGTLLAHGQLGVQQDTQGLFWVLLCRLSVPGLSWCLRLLLARSRTLHFLLLSFIPDQPIYPA